MWAPNLVYNGSIMGVQGFRIRGHARGPWDLPWDLLWILTSHAVSRRRPSIIKVRTEEALYKPHRAAYPLREAAAQQNRYSLPKPREPNIAYLRNRRQII